jgi:hypothetical protein
MHPGVAVWFVTLSIPTVVIDRQRVQTEVTVLSWRVRVAPTGAGRPVANPTRENVMAATLPSKVSVLVKAF